MLIGNKTDLEHAALFPNHLINQYSYLKIITEPTKQLWLLAQKTSL
ncbi:hypothetical protein C8N47_101246 [Mangrovibacterium marinum]|uniref:Uncharacterized protein n=1 Tax=Mangrovibacterium marinum TaxID=1639118 RepID=A0A2T5C6P1_9BACT|nr:hypothetical protein C8N47_101246 [Mangrovibacterium marinum]